MPEHDFELYLSLLSRFLRLKPAQHAEIADELRDHLEQRLEELSARGISRDDAIRKALDEFGDAAELANHFTRATHIRRRRLIMRCTAGTIGTVAAALLVATAFWPESGRSPLPARAIAQQNSADTPAKEDAAPAARVEMGRDEAEAKLKKRLESLELVDMPLEEAVEFFGEQTGLDILLDKPALNEEGIQRDQPISLSIKRNPIEAGLALKLILEPLQLGYIFRDNIVVITTVQKLSEVLEIRVYNVSDLLAENDTGASLVNVGMQGGGMGGGGHFSVYSILPAVAGQFGGAPPAEEKAPPAASAAAPLSHKPFSLADVVERSVSPDSWSNLGGHGSISQYNGLLVVNQTEAVHEKVDHLLELMRTSLNK